LLLYFGQVWGVDGFYFTPDWYFYHADMHIFGGPFRGCYEVAMTQSIRVMCWSQTWVQANWRRERVVITLCFHWWFLAAVRIV
jgi:hypothetical protein